jgi:putative oxidoreductase
MKKFFFDCGTRDATASQGILVLRVFTGLMMLVGHGIPKIHHYVALKNTFYVPDFFPLKYLSPPLSLMACTGAEVVASILILLGLFTRPAAFLLGFSMVVAVFGAQGSAPWFISPPTVLNAKELGLLYLIPLISLIFSGGGALSLDARLSKNGRRRRW